MPKTRYTACPICGNLTRKRSRYCLQHANQLRRYGDPKGKPVEYRSEVAPRFSAWIREGFARWRHHAALQACLKITEQALSYTATDDGTAFGHQLRTARAMADLRGHEIAPEALFCRVAEFAAYFEHHRGTMTLREEDFALARGVLHIIRWKGEGAGQGSQLLQSVGTHIRQTVLPGAYAFVRRLIKDGEEQGELMRQAVQFG